MTITEITRIANNYTDEVFTSSVCLDFANEAIAKINAMLGAKLPYYAITGDYSTTILGDEWQRTVIVPYVSYSIKLNDGSINESQVNFLQRYEEALKELRKNKATAIPDTKDANGNFLYRKATFGGIATMPKLGTYVKHPDDLEEEDYNDKIPL
jgi:hypothetical protein